MAENKNPMVTIEMENGSIMKAELYPDKAPETVANFVSLAGKGFYDGLIFHRVIPGFMIQGGDPKGTGMYGPGYSIYGEFSNNGFRQNDLKHTLGVLSMARTSDPDSAGSQFFIMVAPAPHLDGNYAAFGQVYEGVEEAVRISEVPTDRNDRPKSPVVIKSIRVDTKGVTYPEPRKGEEVVG
jgi:peptidyl-prolyl cis-trans isomerase B (cyclophilin B)